jgi:hypothetical protein
MEDQAMTFSKSTLVGLTLLGIASSGAYAQMTQQPGQQTLRPGQQAQQPAQQTLPAAPNSAPTQRLTPAPATSSVTSPATSSTPSTAPGAMGKKPTLQALDKDHDGMVSMTEAAAEPKLAKKFAQLDRNRDGKLDAGEFSMYMP